MKKVIDSGKKSKAVSEVENPVKNSKNPQTLLEISPFLEISSREQKEVLPSHKQQDHAYE